MRGEPIIADQRAAVWLGVGLTVAGALVLWDAYGHRGQSKPFGLRLLGLVG